MARHSWACAGLAIFVCAAVALTFLQISVDRTPHYDAQTQSLVFEEPLAQIVIFHLLGIMAMISYLGYKSMATLHRFDLKLLIFGSVALLVSVAPAFPQVAAEMENFGSPIVLIGAPGNEVSMWAKDQGYYEMSSEVNGLVKTSTVVLTPALAEAFETGGMDALHNEVQNDYYQAHRGSQN